MCVCVCVYTRVCLSYVIILSKKTCLPLTACGCGNRAKAGFPLTRFWAARLG